MELFRRLCRIILLPDPNVLWVLGARRQCLRALDRYPCQAVLTTSPPHSLHFIGRWLKHRQRLPWIADFRDGWSADGDRAGVRGTLPQAIHRRMEREVLTSCDRAIFVTGPLAELAPLPRHFDPASKRTVITNGYDPDDFSGGQPQEPSRFVIAHVGTVLGPQTRNAFPEGLRLALDRDQDFRREAVVRFIGTVDPRYRRRLAGLERNVEFAKPVPHRQAVDAMRAAHLLLLVLPDTRLARATYTNKFFEYLAAARPILAVVPPGLVSSLVVEHQRGLVVSPDDPSAIAQSLIELYSAVRSGGFVLPQPLGRFAAFERRNLANRLAGLLDEVAGLA